MFSKCVLRPIWSYSYPVIMLPRSSVENIYS